MSRKVPAALNQLVETWRSEGSPSQAPMGWPRSRWSDRLGQHGASLSRLPDELDRDTVRLVCKNAGASAEAAEGAFVAVMAWGYGIVGYGPWRVARVLSQNRGAALRLREVAATLSTAGALAAYKRFADYQDCRLRYLGPAFGTKYLAFCSTDERRPALILDRLVSSWLSRNADLALDAVPWDVSTYQRYLEYMYRWSDLLGVRPDDLECLMFSAESAAAGNQWAYPRSFDPNIARQTRVLPERHDRRMSNASSGHRPEKTILAVRMVVEGVYPPYRDAYEFTPTEGRKWVQSAHHFEVDDLSAMPTIVGRCEQMPTSSWEWLSRRIAESGFYDVGGDPSYPATDIPTWHVQVVGDGFRTHVVSYGGGVAPREGDEPDDDLVAIHDAVCVIEEMVRRVPWREELALQSMMDPGPLHDLMLET